MTVTQLRKMPPSGTTFSKVPEPITHLLCSSTVQIVGAHPEKWRKQNLGDRWQLCTRPAVVILNDAPLCRRHAGERCLEMYMRGELRHYVGNAPTETARD